MNNNWLFFNKLKHVAVRTADHDKTGSLDDAVVDLQSGEIMFYTLSSGGFLGIGGERAALPPNALRFAGDDANLMVNEQKLHVAPGTASDWPERIDSTFIDEVHRYYGYKQA